MRAGGRRAVAGSASFYFCQKKAREQILQNVTVCLIRVVGYIQSAPLLTLPFVCFTQFTISKIVRKGVWNRDDAGRAGVSFAVGNVFPQGGEHVTS